MDVHWKAIADFPGYEVSDLGEVRSISSPSSRRHGKVLKRALNSKGYLCIGLYRGGKRYNARVHALVATAFLGERPSEKHEVAHNDGNPLNVAAANLRWATRADNHADKLLHGTHNRGERHGLSRLTNEQAKSAIAQRNEGWSIKQLASEYGIAYGTMDKLLRGISWDWLPRPPKRDHRRKDAP